MDPSSRREWLRGCLEDLTLPDRVDSALADWPGRHLALYTRATQDGEPVPVLDLGHAQLKLRLPEFARMRRRLVERGFEFSDHPLPSEVICSYPHRRKDPSMG